MAKYSNKRRTFLKTTGAAGTAGLTTIAGCSTITGSGTTELGFAFNVPIENITSLFAVPEIQDQLTNYGSEYEFTANQYQSTPDSLNAMAAGEVDLALLATVSFASAVEQEAVPGNIKLISTDFWDADPEWYGFTVYSGPDSEITETADLRNQQIGVNGLGTGVHGIFAKRLQQEGIDPENGVEFTELPFPSFVSAIQDGRLDAAIFPASFGVSARSENFTEVFSSQDIWDERYPFAYTAASNNAIDEKSDAINAWGEDLAELIEYCFNNRSDAITAATNHFDFPKSLAEAFFLTNQDFFRREVRLDLDRLQFIIDELVDIGFVNESFDVQNYATNEFLPSS